MTGIDIAVIALYAGAVLALGAVAARSGGVRDGRDERDGRSDDWMLAGRSLPTWAAMLSLTATELSAATFIGVPHAAYVGDWSYLQLAVGALLGKALLARFAYPRFRALGIVTVYGFLGERFGAGAQRAAALCFVAGRTLASGARLFIAALALAAAAGWSLEWSIIGCGLVCAVYTTAGGLRAVVWTDVLQAAVLLTGATILAGLLSLEAGGLTALLAWGAEADRTEVWQAPPWIALGSATPIGSALLGGLFLTLATHGTDHDMAQRLLAVRSDRGGPRALWGTALLNFPLTALFLLIGTGLAMHYAQPGVPPPSDPDRVVAIFALEALPAGARGLLFAGLFAAAMSSLDSAVCAIATTWAADIAPRGASGGDPVIRRRSLTAAAGVVLAALAVAAYHRALSSSDHPPALGLVEVALSSMTVLYGGLLGIFALGLLTRRAVPTGAVVLGLAAGALVGLGLFLHPVSMGGVWVAWVWWVPSGAVAAVAATAIATALSDRIASGRVG